MGLVFGCAELGEAAVDFVGMKAGLLRVNRYPEEGSGVWFQPLPMSNFVQLYERLGVSQVRLEEFCAELPIEELALFGSVLRDDFRAESDVDVLVRLVPGHGMSLMDFVALEEELEALFERDVDLIERETVEADRNWIRRQEILAQAQVIYGSQSVLSA